MQIKREPIVFHNLISTKGICELDKWSELARSLRNEIISSGLYMNAPLIYRYIKVEEGKYEYTLYMPVNAEVKEQAGQKFSFIKELAIKDAFVFRLCDLEKKGEAEAHLLLEAAAYSQKVTVEKPFYNVCLNVFGEMMLDIIAPVNGVLTEEDEEKERS